MRVDKRGAQRARRGFAPDRSRVAARRDAGAGHRGERRDGLRDAQGDRARRRGDPAARDRAQRAVARRASAATGASPTGGRSRSPPASNAAAIACPTSLPPQSLAEWLAAWNGGGILLAPEADRSLAALARPPAPLALADRPGGRVRCARSARRRARRASTRCGSGRACCAPRPRRRRASPSCRRCGGIGDDAIDDGAGHRRGAGRLRDAAALPASAAARLRYAYVVLGEEGRPVARVITAAAACPAIDLDGVARPMDVRAPPVTVPLRPTRSDPRSRSRRRFRCSSARNSFRRACGGPRSPAASCRCREPNPQRIVVLGDTGCRIKTVGPRVPGVQRRGAWPFAARGRRGGGCRTGPRHPRRRLSLPRERVPGGQRRVRRQPVGLRLGRVGGRSLRAGAKAPRGGAVDRRPRQSRVVQPRGSGLVALPRSAAARPRGRTATTRRTTRSATTASPTRCRSARAATPTPSSSCSIRRWSASRRWPPTDPMYVEYRAQFERAFALAARRPDSVLHEPPSDPRRLRRTREARRAVPRQRRAAIGAGRAAADRAVPAQRAGAPRRSRAPVRGRELLDAAAGAVRLRQRRRLARRAAAVCRCRRERRPRPARWSRASSPRTGSAS